LNRSTDRKNLADRGPVVAADAHEPARVARVTGRDTVQPADGKPRAGWVWAIAVFLVLIVGLVFGQTVRHEFLDFDDDVFVYRNPYVSAGLTLDGFRWALTQGPAGDWYPVAMVSHMLDCQLYGLKPAGHYLTNVLLHATSAVLLFLVLLRMTGDLWPSAWVAAVFAIHPLHVESVAWVAERRDVLSGLFFMLTLGAYVEYVRHSFSVWRYLAVVVLLALGLMSKSILVTLPFLLLLLDYWPLRRYERSATTGSRFDSSPWPRRSSTCWRLVVEKIPLMAVAGASCLIELSTHAALPADLVEQPSIAARLADALVSCATYLGQSFYPVDLAPFYPPPADGQPIAKIVGAAILLLAITAVAAYFWRRRPCLLVGWLWYLGMLVPVLGLVRVGFHARADRYTYLSQIGLSIALAWGIWTIYQEQSSNRPMRWRSWTLGIASVGTMLILATVAWHQTSYWRNTEALWTHTQSCTANNVMAHLGLAGAYSRQGKTEEVVTELRAALLAGSINPRNPEITANAESTLANVLVSQGKIDEAIAHYEQALKVRRLDAVAHRGLAAALAKAGKTEEAIAEWQEAIRLIPAYLHAEIEFQSRVELANALLGKGDVAGAAEQCDAVLKVIEYYAPAHATLAEILLGEGKISEAIMHLKQAVRFEPRNAAVSLRLGLVLYDQGQSQEAFSILNQAISLHPDNVPLLWQTAWILATSPRSELRDGAIAVELAKRAAWLCGGREPRALDALAAALAETGDFSGAIEAAEQASITALAQNQDALRDAIAERMRLYRQGLPFRESPSSTDGELPAAEAPPQPNR
jgi:protein O-mannosyl-transferase